MDNRYLDQGGGSGGTATSSPDGSFSLSPPAGTYTVTVGREGFLTAMKGAVVVEAGRVLRLPAVTLLGGDTDGNGVIDLPDVTLPAKNLGRDASPWD